MKGRAVLLLMVGLSGMGVLRRRMGARGEKVKMGSLMVSFLGGQASVLLGTGIFEVLVLSSSSLSILSRTPHSIIIYQ